jgi:phosphatidylinositol alpha-1,6-mannosyltransferase
MPSRGEGFGLVYLEAMRAGVPCIGALDDAAGEVVVNGETGLLVRQSDRAALAGAIAALLGDPPRARAMGRAGQARYESHFTFDAFRDRLAAVLGVGSRATSAEVG